MTVAESIHNAVSKGNIKGIRIMMKNSLLSDPTFTEFNEMENLTRNVSGLYDSHDGREFQLNKTSWNDDYMNKLMVQVVGNFSHERIEHLKDVVRYLRPVTTTRSKATQSSKSGYRRTPSGQQQAQQKGYQEQKHYDQQTGTYRGAKIVSGAAVGAAVGAAAGGLVATAGGLVAAAASVTVIGGAAIGAVASAIVVTVVTNGEK